MMPLQERSAMTQHQLPDNPEDNEIFELPEGQSIGGANVIYILKSGKQVGSAQQLSAVHNVSGKHVAERVTCAEELKVGDIVRVKGLQYNYTSVRFVQFFGWIGHAHSANPITLKDENYRIVAVTLIGTTGDSHRIYEKMCLELIGDKK